MTQLSHFSRRLTHGAIAMLALLGASAVQASPWSAFNTPVAGTPQAVGGYSNGCVIGAEPLPLHGKGYELIRSQRMRYFGHPALIEFVQRLAQHSRQAGLPNFWVGDMAMPAGGRFSSGHASHQNGLDVDIWLRFSRTSLSEQEKQSPKAVSLVDFPRMQVKSALWQPEYTQLIKLAAQDPNVARIFVNPAIKQQLCVSTQGEDRSWLRKVRPWGGHDYHMHVRLDCPPGSQDCKPQSPPPPGDGCGDELLSWLQPPPSVNLPLMAPKPAPLPPPLPAACQSLLLSQHGTVKATARNNG